MKRLVMFIVFAAMLLAACTGGQQPVPATYTPAPTGTPIPVTETPVVTPSPDGGSSSSDLTPAQVKALEALAGQLGIAPGEIKVVQFEAVQWPDGCLGVIRIDATCLAAITPGYRIILDAGGKLYEFHTNEDGSAVVQAALGEVNGEDPGLQSAIDQLASALGIPADQIKVVSNSAIEWMDACLGVSLPGVVCAQVATPGRTIMLEANGMQYEYHTNQDSTVVVPATLALTWHQEGGMTGTSDDLSVFLPGSANSSWSKPAAGEAQGDLSKLLSADERAQLDQWLARYGQVAVTKEGNIAADEMSSNLMLFGRGTEQPDDATQQAMLSFAQALFEKMKQ